MVFEGKKALVDARCNHGGWMVNGAFDAVDVGRQGAPVVVGVPQGGVVGGTVV
jgi:hypothetical protein